MMVTQKIKLRWIWVLTLLVCVVVAWLAYQFNQINFAEKRNAELREWIVGTRHEMSLLAEMENDTPIDWEALSKIKGVTRGSLAGMQLRFKLERRFQSYTTEQLTAVMDQIIASNINQNSKESFGWIVIEILVQRDPELALVRYAKSFRTSDDEPLYPLTKAIKCWARKDAAAAVAWYDKEIAAGTFLGVELKTNERSLAEYNLQLLTALIDVDLELVKSRSSSYKDIDYKIDINEVKFENFATYIRAVYSNPSDQIRLLSWAVDDLAERKGYADVTRYMEEVSATAAEKKEIVRICCVRKGITSSEDIKSMRMWAGVHAPDAVDEITGEVLSRSVSQKPSQRGMSYDQASELASGYHNDETLAAFLYSLVARDNLKKSLLLAEKISDQALREKTINYLK